jgi:hypothetical protein
MRIVVAVSKMGKSLIVHIPRKFTNYDNPIIKKGDYIELNTMEQK